MRTFYAAPAEHRDQLRLLRDSRGGAWMSFAVHLSDGSSRTVRLQLTEQQISDVAISLVPSEPDRGKALVADLQRALDGTTA